MESISTNLNVVGHHNQTKECKKKSKYWEKVQTVTAKEQKTLFCEELRQTSDSETDNSCRQPPHNAVTSAVNAVIAVNGVNAVTRRQARDEDWQTVFGDSWKTFYNIEIGFKFWFYF